MKQTKSILRRAAALALAVLLAVPTAHAAAGERKLRTSIPIVDGLTYHNTVTVNGERRIESFSLELEPGGQAQPIFLQGSGTIYGTASINRAVTTAQERGYHVLGAINTDFFSMSTGVPLGIVIEDGVYQSSTDGEHALLITDGEMSVAPSPQVTMALVNQSTGEITTPHNFNKARHDTGGLYLLNGHFSTVSTRSDSPGWYVRMRALPDPYTDEVPELTVNSTLDLVVTEVLASSQSTAIGPDEYILTAADQSGYDFVFSSFQVGDQVTLATACEDPNLSEAQWAGGVGDLMVADGVITDSSTWTYAKDGRQPRSALGIKGDGTVVLYAVDGRQSGYSAGLSQLDLADELLAQGCQWVVNLDGGGSTALSVWLPSQNGSALQNKPSDGKPRGCATYLMLVTDERGDGEAHRLALSPDGQVVLTGSSLPLPQAVAVDQGLNPVSTRLDDLRFRSEHELGEIEDGLYIAGDIPGTDTILCYDRHEDLEGTAQIHVVDQLTSFTVSKAGSSSPLSTLTVEPGEEIPLAFTGEYWGRPALRDLAPVTWTVEGDVGSVDENGVFTASESRANGSITFSAGGLSQTVRVTMANVHEDIPEDHWAYEAVEYCYEHGIVTGVSPTLFGRDNQIRRGDFTLMLYGALGRPPVTGSSTFTDVSPDDYYYTALTWAQQAGLASGTGGGGYSPAAPVTREQSFTILRQTMPLLDKNCPDGDLSILDQFADKDLIADYAKGHTATLVSQELVSGRGDRVDPRGNLTRAEMAAILYKLITFTPTGPEPTQPERPAEPELPITPEPPVDLDPPQKPEVPEQPVDPSGYILALDRNQLELASGQTAGITAVLLPYLEGASITWTSSNPAAAAVSPDGQVTNLHPGGKAVSVTITASWNGVSSACAVTCAPAQRSGLVVNAQLGLNVRSAPTTAAPVSGSLANNSQVLVLGEESGWYQVLYLGSGGQAATGYVSGDYLLVTP